MCNWSHKRGMRDNGTEKIFEETMDECIQALGKIYMYLMNYSKSLAN